MFEYHGWATLRSDTYGTEVSPISRPRLEDLRRSLVNLDGSGESGVRFINGSLQLWLSGSPNHRHNLVVEFFRGLATGFPGSYGILYIWDDESEHDNAFRVFRLARGKVEELDDPFLSPCVPTIEDPYDPERCD
jgi:Immunity protein 7